MIKPYSGQTVDFSISAATHTILLQYWIARNLHLATDNFAIGIVLWGLKFALLSVLRHRCLSHFGATAEFRYRLAGIFGDCIVFCCYGESILSALISSNVMRNYTARYSFDVFPNLSNVVAQAAPDIGTALWCVVVDNRRNLS